MKQTNGTGSTTEKLLIKRLKVSGLLSFGPKGIDLPMRGLNVLIGANGSGKSNFLEVLGILRSAARGQFGIGGELLWKGEGDHGLGEATIEATISNPTEDLRHILTVFESGPRLEIADERIGPGERSEAQSLYYSYERGHPFIVGPDGREEKRAPSMRIARLWRK